MLVRWIKSQSHKLFNRTEWQAFLVSVGVMFANRFFDLGLTEVEVAAMFVGAGGYGLSRGQAKSNRVVVKTMTRTIGEVTATDTESEPAGE